MITYNKKTKAVVATVLKKNLFNCAVLSTLLRRCHIFNFILSLSFNDEHKLTVTFQFPLAKGTFNYTQV